MITYLDTTPSHGWTVFEVVHLPQDRLGWDNFVEGRISKVLLQVVSDSFDTSGSRSSPEAWCRKLICQLLQITHSQWIFRNSNVHLKKKLDGLTVAQHEQILIMLLS